MKILKNLLTIFFQQVYETITINKELKIHQFLHEKDEDLEL